ncbi:MAG TPA: cellobiose phosphorylase, partial [Candidatus Blautia merdigallinarum]|nr:cellobiose phosphorylase [Candidatus Blautia merdigallinarum]
DQEEEIDQLFEKCNTADKTEALLEETKAYWQKKVNVGFHTGDRDFDNYMKWVCFQPFLRRLFGCSFLPHHDYGRGGRGWRDLWQDCLSLLLMDPKDVGMMIEKNFSGVRIDGTNATIIGAGDGNFIADRNGIARVWMDHGLWPQMTTKLYIDQTGDIRILTRQVPYFKDGQARRGTELDTLWTESQGNLQMTGQEQIYTGSILEHLLIQQLTAFYEVGEHNICRLRGADWNDALDMASERGESVAFTCAYAGNLRELAELIRALADTGSVKTTDLLEELEVLLKDDKELYDNISEKQQVLARFTSLCRHHVSGRRKTFSLLSLAENLEHKAQWLSGHIRKQEWIQAGQGEGWFNSYYDNHGQAVEGILEDQVRMMLTGQVFAIMGKVAEDPQIRSIIKSADHYLYEKEIGGYRLNTDFHELKFDLGRMFGFAYGEKENGAVFSHMAVMYGNALYRRGYAKEGWKVLKSLSDTALDFDTSRIYPGIPEYFRSDGRGMYHYLTGAASWYMLTMVTQVFGVRGEGGDLIIAPKLLAEQFDSQGKASIQIAFANKTLEVIFENTGRKDYGDYTLTSAVCEGRKLPVVDNSYGVLSQKTLDSLGDGLHSVTIKLI